MKFTLHFGFYTEGLAFDGSPIEEQSLGGSESALYFMARELAKRGHRVDVFCNCKRPGLYDGVRYHAAETFRREAQFAEFDVFVAHRFFQAQDLAPKAKLVWQWVHDMPIGEVRTTLAPHLWRTDQVIFLSEFQKAAYTKDVPELERIAWLSKNGVDLGLLDRCSAGAERDKNLLVYSSRPERGLARLILKIWPKLHEWRPELRLAVCSYDMTGWNFPPAMQRMYAQLDQAMDQSPGVTRLGAQSKKEFYRLLASAGAVVYPTSFPEISCITALEAMASGTPIITTADFALTETVPYPGVPGHEEDGYDDRFVAAVKELLEDQVLYKRRQKEGTDHVRGRYAWSQIAREWEERAYGMFRDRTRGREQRVFDQLVYESDLLAARSYLFDIGADELLEEGDSLPAGWKVTAPDGGTAANIWIDRILTSHHEEPDAYSDGAGEQVNAGWNTNGRFKHITSLIPKDAKRVLDVGCGAGGLLAHIHQTRPELSLHGIDFSPALVDRARRFHVSVFGGNPAEIFCGDATAKGDVGQYDCVISSEVLEHQVDPVAFLEGLEKRCRRGGRVILTTPAGPWESISHTKPAAEARNDWERNRFHVSHFTARDLGELFGKKKELHVEFRAAGYSPRGELIGWHFIAWTVGKEPFGAIDYERKWMTTRPYQKVALCMIVKNEEEGIIRALRSAIDVVDEIHILDTGSTDGTRALIQKIVDEERYSPKIFVTECAWEDIRPVKADGTDEAEVRCDAKIEELRLIDFSRARNLSTQAAIARGADWILWLDGDEQLQGAGGIRRYLDGELFPALVIPQMNLNLDVPENVEIETPYRLFRPSRGLEFRGVIHEQPSFDVNRNPEPALHLPDARIVHYGYLDPRWTRRKCFERNMPLIVKDRYVYKDRILGKLNVLRDYVHLAGQDMAANAGQPTEQAVDFLRRAARMYRESFVRDRKHVYFTYATRFYQDALRLLAACGQEVSKGWGVPFETHTVLIAAPGGIPDGAEMPQPIRRWFASRREYEIAIERSVDETFEKFGGTYGRDAEGNDRRGEGDPAADPVRNDAPAAEVLRGADHQVHGGRPDALLPDADAEAERAAASE